MVEQIDKEKFDELLKGEKPLVCDFFATWCGPCKMLATVMEEVSEKFKDKALFVKVDVDKNAELAARYGIMSIPQISVFKGGEEADKTLGYMGKKALTDYLSEKL